MNEVLETSTGRKLCVYESIILQHLLKNRRADLVSVLKEDQPCLMIDSYELMDVSDIIFTHLMIDPDKWFAKLEEMLRVALETVLAEATQDEKVMYTLRERVPVRLSSLPDVVEFQKLTVPKCEDVGSMISIVGTVTKTSQSRMLTTKKLVECSKCSHQFHVQVDYLQYYEFAAPSLCPNPEGCSGSQYKDKEQFSEDSCKDYQEIKVQEHVSNLALGTIPRSVWVTLEDDLVDSCKPGDDVLAIGCVKRRWKRLGKGKNERTDVDLVIQANSVQVNNEKKLAGTVCQEMEAEIREFWKLHKDMVGRNKILEMFCPQVYGLYLVKLAVAITLAGGVERIDEGGTRVRGEPHLLLVGDPGTGKSQLLKYGSKVSQRSVLTTGIGSSSAGLTVSASREGGQWHLEAGALVLADGGVCCIDEFSSIREADRTCIHEAMEQQSLSVAKAGMVCRLKTRCTVLAATNPKGSYDPEKSISENTAIASPLLSRFDLVLTLLDTKNPDWDRVVSTFILDGKSPSSVNDVGGEAWTFEKIQIYFQFVKKLRPMLSSGANQVLSKYYQRQRSTDSLDQARTTVRLLQSCIRLAQGHARLMCRDEVEVQDAVCAVLLLECSTASSASLVHGGNALHTAFPDDPVEEYRIQAKLILQGLNLHHLWVEESERLNRLTSSLGGAREALPVSQVADRPGRGIDLTQVMKKININRVPSIPVMEPEARKRKKRRTKKKDRAEGAEEAAGETSDIENDDPETSEDDDGDFEKKTKRPKQSITETSKISKPTVPPLEQSIILSPPSNGPGIIPDRFPSLGKSQDDADVCSNISVNERKSPKSSGEETPSPRPNQVSSKTKKKLQSFSFSSSSSTDLEYSTLESDQSLDDSVIKQTQNESAEKTARKSIVEPSEKETENNTENKSVQQQEQKEVGIILTASESIENQSQGKSVSNNAANCSSSEIAGSEFSVNQASLQSTVNQTVNQSTSKQTDKQNVNHQSSSQISQTNTVKTGPQLTKEKLTSLMKLIKKPVVRPPTLPSKSITSSLFEEDLDSLTDFDFGS